MNDLSDRELIHQFVAAKSDEAFAQIVLRYAAMVYHSALRQVGDWPTAQDVTQTVFIVLWKKAGGLRDATALPAWLLSVTRLAARDAVKRREARKRNEQKAVAMNTSAESIDLNALAWHLDGALASLPALDRSAVAMRYLSAMSFKQVGHALGVSDEAAKKRTARALEKLRAVLLRRGINSPADLLEESLAQFALLPVPPALTAQVLHAARNGPTVSAAGITKGVLMALRIKAAATVSAAALLLLAAVATVVVATARVYISGETKPSITLASQAPQTRPAAAPVTNAPVSGEYYVGGLVDRAGPYSVSTQQRIPTLRQALVAAGLSNVNIQTAAVHVIHRGANRQESESDYKLQDILSGRSSPVNVLPNDMIIVLRQN